MTAITKESLLSFVLTADIAEVQEMSGETQFRLAELNALGVGFRPFPKVTVPQQVTLLPSEILDWIATVRQPAGDEFSDRATRNRLVFEVEKLGEFHETLLARIHNRLPPYVA